MRTTTVDAVLRKQMNLNKGVKIKKHFQGHGIAVASRHPRQEREDPVSTLYHGQNRDVWLTKYTDGHEEHFEEEELRSGKDGPAPPGQDGKLVLIIRDHPKRTA